VCTAGCELRARDGTVLGPRQLDAAELLAHDDKHVSHKARVLVRMLRDLAPELRAEVLDYFAEPLPRFAHRLR
jgi:hypothetical protein